MWKKVIEFLSAIGGAIASFFTTMPPLVYILIGVMSIDYVTGLICGAMGKSKKTETGYLASHEAWKGLLKKGVILLVVLLANLLDIAVSKGTGITVEAVPVPKVLINLLEIMRQKGDGQDSKEEKKPENPEE